MAMQLTRSIELELLFWLKGQDSYLHPAAPILRAYIFPISPIPIIPTVVFAIATSAVE